MKILIVEDKEIQRVSLQDDLLDAGYETMAVESPRLALEMLKEESFDVVLSDLKMPGVDGVMLLERVLAWFEKNLINEALVKTDGNRVKAAELLQLPTSTLKNKMKKTVLHSAPGGSLIYISNQKQQKRW